jgi:hypothetical protein
VLTSDTVFGEGCDSRAIKFLAEQKRTGMIQAVRPNLFRFLVDKSGIRLGVLDSWSNRMTADELATAVGTEAANELTSALAKITHCLAQLADEQVWWRARPALNSIGNLVLHLCGNLRQWIVAGLGEAADLRDRPAEFAERGPIPKGELLRRLETGVREAKEVLSRLTPRQLGQARRIQGFEVTGLAAIFDSVPHFRGHTQEIVSLTRMQLGDAYKFAWTPATAEEGAAP